MARSFPPEYWLDDLSEPEEELASQSDLRTNSRRIARNLNERKSEFLTCSDIEQLTNTSRFVDPELTASLGSVSQPRWLVMHCCGEHIWTIARHPESPRRASYRSSSPEGVENPWLALDRRSSAFWVDVGGRCRAAMLNSCGSGWPTGWFQAGVRYSLMSPPQVL